MKTLELFKELKSNLDTNAIHGGGSTASAKVFLYKNTVARITMH